MDATERQWRKERDNRVEKRSDDLKRTRNIERANGRHAYRNRPRAGPGKGDFNRSVDNKAAFDAGMDSMYPPFCDRCSGFSSHRRDCILHPEYTEEDLGESKLRVKFGP